MVTEQDVRSREWPKCMRMETAAAYLDVSEAEFLASIAARVRSFYLTSRVKVWLRDDIDAWLDAEAGKSTWIG